MTPQLFIAFKQVKAQFPSLSIVVFNAQGNWSYMDENFDAFDFEEKMDLGLITQEVLEDASDSMTTLPYIFQLDEKSYYVLHNVDSEKVSHWKSDSEFIDFMKRIAIENGDEDYSILGISDALEYLEDFCEGLTLLNDEDDEEEDEEEDEIKLSACCSAPIRHAVIDINGTDLDSDGTECSDCGAEYPDEE